MLRIYFPGPFVVVLKFRSSLRSSAIKGLPSARAPALSNALRRRTTRVDPASRSGHNLTSRRRPRRSVECCTTSSPQHLTFQLARSFRLRTYLRTSSRQAMRAHDDSPLAPCPATPAMYSCSLQKSRDRRLGSVGVVRAPAHALCGAESSYMGSHPFSTSRSPSFFQFSGQNARQHIVLDLGVYRPGFSTLTVTASAQSIDAPSLLVRKVRFGPHHWCLPLSRDPRLWCRLGRWLFSNAASRCCSTVSSFG